MQSTAIVARDAARMRGGDSQCAATQRLWVHPPHGAGHQYLFAGARMPDSASVQPVQRRFRFG